MSHLDPWISEINRTSRALSLYDEVETGQHDHELDALAVAAERSEVPYRTLLREAISNRRAMLTERPFDQMTPAERATHLYEAHGIDAGVGDDLAEHLDDHRHYEHTHAHDEN